MVGGGEGKREAGRLGGGGGGGGEAGDVEEGGDEGELSSNERRVSERNLSGLEFDFLV